MTGIVVSKVVSPGKIAASLSEYWSPRIIARVDDACVKVAKVNGVLGWHRHLDEDEMFFVLDGSLHIDLEDGSSVDLAAGDLHVVPKGVRHNPRADNDCLLVLVERESTLHTGDVVNEFTRSLDEQRRPIEDA
ncbi:MAG: cupin domain-containing protein [Dokdonella sp.]|uniref:cupin domain-containing protein n=1 Tax=Dokdonella sp. TaxID=2291710 RepID=UPI002B89574F|nr:cupin domain-containing protein [Dokdonella sp.]HPG93058.1 cupin domain-containing protein [Dokdonella sp.]HPN80467.1 cupin domain-containing protein [Dokdonella sp.]